METFDQYGLIELTDPSQLDIGTKIVANVWLGKETMYGYYEMTSGWDGSEIAMTYHAPDGSTFNSNFGSGGCKRQTNIWWYVINEEMPYDPNGEGETDQDI